MNVKSLALSFILTCFSLAAPLQGSAALSAAPFKIPVQLEKSSLTFEHGIDEDLMRLYYQELKELKSQLPSELSKVEKRAAQQKLLSERNQKTLENFKKNASSKPASHAKIQNLTKEQAQKILDLVKGHPVVGMERILQYDPHLEVGFCFGRAAYLHMELLRHGVDTNAIAKVFMVGPLTALKSQWDFHMAVLVKAPGDQWWVLDNFVEKVLTLDEWIFETTKLAQNSKSPLLRIYLADALKFQPSLGVYSRENMSFSYFNGYFADLMKWFQTHPVVPKKSFQSQPGT